MHPLKGRKHPADCAHCIAVRTALRTHGETKTRLFQIRNMMLGRCYNPRHHKFPDYGGRGITVCSEWRDSYLSFREWAHEHGYKDDLTIDRINNDGNYEPANCRWSTYREQCHNTRRNRWLTAFGETRLISEWPSDPRCVVSRDTITKRINMGMSAEQAITLGRQHRYHSVYGEHVG